jgi:hypothetical protein
VSRNLSGPAAAIITGEVAYRTVAVALSYPSGWARWNGSPADLTINGETYVGIGGFGSISAAQESAELRSYDLTVRISGVPNTAVALAMGEAYQGRAGVVWEVPLHPTTGQPVGEFVIFRGRMDQMVVEMGTESVVTVTLLNRMADWEKPRVRRYTHGDQLARYPGDNGLRFLPATTERQIIWPASAWWDKRR